MEGAWHSRNKGKNGTDENRKELGHITPEEAVNYPHRNVLYRALAQGEILDPDIFTLAFPQPGYLMICSGGLWGVVSEQDLIRSINESPNL